MTRESPFQSGATVEWICGLTGFVLVVTAFAAIGHGIWLLGASILGSIFGTQKAQQPQANRPFRECPACQVEVDSRDIKCPECELVLDSQLAWKLARVRTAKTEIETLREAGDLDPDTARTVTEQLKRRARTLRGLPIAHPQRPGFPRSAPKTASPATPLPEPTFTPAPEPLPLPEPELSPRIESVPVPVEASVPLPLPEPPVETLPKPRRPAPPPHDRAPAEPPSRGSVVAAFMEERNILWGELVGGLLIVGCSIALVVTLWRSLESIPYFPFLLSAAITLALYGAGQYTLHHWKLTSTSRGLLVIALLLAPLNLLLLSDAITRGEASVPIDVGVKLFAVALFAWVARGGGRDILTARPGWRWLLALAVVGAPATQLIPLTWFPDQQIRSSVGMARARMFCCRCCDCAEGPIGIWEKAAGVPESLEPTVGTALLSFVGLAAFSLLAAWGLHIARSPDVAERIAGLALPLALAGVPIVEAGLLVQRRTREGGLQATGTAVALAGFIAITGGLTAAWPDPLRVMLVSTATGLFLTRIAFRESLVWAHAGAIPALALATVVGYHGLAGHWLITGPREGLRTLFFPAVQGTAYSLDPEAGVVLAAFALLMAMVAELLARRGSRTHAVSYALGAVASGLVGLFLVSVNGIEYPLRAAVVYGGCAAGLLASNYRWQLRVAAHGGLWLILVGSLWAMHATYRDDLARWGFVVSLWKLLGVCRTLAWPEGLPLSFARLAPAGWPGCVARRGDSGLCVPAAIADRQHPPASAVAYVDHSLPSPSPLSRSPV